QYNLKELVVEYRLLRRITIEEIESALHRNMTAMEQVALHMGIDAMLQHAILTFVEQQQAQLRTATEAESKYLSFISHDLRNNLNNMTLTLELIRRRLAGVAGMEEDVADLNSLQQAVLTTVAGMDRLLQTERLRRQSQAQVAPVDLHEVVSKVIQQFAAQSQQKNLGLMMQVPPDARINSDGEWIRLVLQNLVGNAVKYSSQGTIRIQAEARPAGEGWVLSVSDEGPGIAPDQVHRLFEEFQRGDTHGQTGVGLGLAIASQAARRLGGQLTVESTVGVGTTFRVILPELQAG
ncbi:MAG: sensor histidine kinase, partial [Bacillota bacterium]